MNFYFKVTNGYVILPGYDCGGGQLRVWANGAGSNYGTTRATSIDDTSKCEKICNDHTECAGFVHNTRTGICGYWTGAPPPTHPYKTGFPRTCHKKTSGNVFTKRAKIIVMRFLNNASQLFSVLYYCSHIKLCL